MCHHYIPKASMTIRKTKNKTKRQEQAEHTKKRIYEAATQLIEKYGFETVTVDEICKVAGIAKGGFYHHFPSKGELVIETYRGIDSEYMDAVAKLPADMSPRGHILFTTCFMARIADEKGHEFCREIYKGQLDWGTDFLLSRDRPFYNMLYLNVKKSLEGKDASLFPPAHDLTRMFLLSARGAIYDWSLAQGAYDLELIVRQLIGYLYDGVFKPD